MRLLAPYSRGIEPFLWWDGAFTVEEIDQLRAMASNATSDAYVGDGQQNPELRRSQVQWINPREHAWVFDRLAHVVSTLNAQHYNFDLTGFGEDIQLTNYKAEQQGTYGWHQDFGAKSISRKLSLVLQLSDPAQYEGGQLELMTQTDPARIEKRRGLITVFPAWVVHRVTPVTQGSRQSLVAWISGPQFR